MMENVSPVGEGVLPSAIPPTKGYRLLLEYREPGGHLVYVGDRFEHELGADEALYVVANILIGRGQHIPAWLKTEGEHKAREQALGIHHHERTEAIAAYLRRVAAVDELLAACKGVCGDLGHAEWGTDEHGSMLLKSIIDKHHPILKAAVVKANLAGQKGGGHV